MNFTFLRMLLGFFVGLLILPPAFSQNRIDSLKNLLKKDKNDTTQVILLNNIAYLSASEKPLDTYEYAKQAMALAKKLDYKNGIMLAYNNLGIYYIVSSTHDKAIEHLVAGLKIAESLKNENWMGTFNLNIGLVHSEMKNFEEAISYYKIALPHSQKAKNVVNTINIYNNMGYTYILMKRFDDAMPPLKEVKKWLLKSKT